MHVYLTLLDGIPLKQAFDLELPTCSQLHHFVLPQCLACELKYNNMYIFSNFSSPPLSTVVLHVYQNFYYKIKYPHKIVTFANSMGRCKYTIVSFTAIIWVIIR